MEIPVSGAKITSIDKSHIQNVLLSGWITDGEYHTKFKKSLSKVTGTHHVTLCNSGSSALLLAINACSEEFQSKENGKKFIITCATGFPTTIVPAIQAGFIPYFVDIDRKTLQIDYDTVLDVIAKENDVAGIMVAHTLGFPFQADLLSEDIFPDQFLIEDCSDALGAKIENSYVGSFGDVSTYSFFPAHHITTGEGGAVATNSGRVHKLLESYNNWGRDCWCKPGDSNTCNKRFEHRMGSLPEGYDHKYIFTRLGYNLKMTEFQAALGYSQIQRLDKIVRERVLNFAIIYAELADYETIDVIEWNTLLTTPSPFGFPITVNEKADFTAKEMINYLEINGVRTRPIFGGNLIRQPFMRCQPYMVAGSLKNSDYIMNNSFWVGCHDNLSDEQVDYLVKVLKRYLNG